MATIRSSGNKDTELRLIGLMRAAGIQGWRRGVKLRFGGKGQGAGGKGATGDSVRSVSSVVKSEFVTIRPDFVFPKPRLAVFVDGCFWHACPRHATWPKNRAAFWLAKLTGNKARDRRTNVILRAHGWRVLRIWEHALTSKFAVRTVARVRTALADRRR